MSSDKMADNFRTAAQNYQVRSTLVIGASFGIFLTFGQAWSEFIKESIIAMIPQDQENEFVKATIYAIGATMICTIAMFAIIKLDTYCSESYKNTMKIKRHVFKMSQGGKTQKKIIKTTKNKN